MTTIHGKFEGPISHVIFGSIFCLGFVLMVSNANAQSGTTQPTTAPSTTLVYPTLPNNWQQMSVGDLATAVKGYYKSHGHDLLGVPQRSRLASYVWANYLVDDQHFQQALVTDSDSTTRLVTLVVPDLTPADVSMTAARFSALATNQNPNGSASVIQLSAGQLSHLSLALHALGVPDEVRWNMAQVWIAGSNSWSNLSATNLGLLGIIFQGDASQARLATRQTLANSAWTRFLSDPNYVATSKFVELTRLLVAYGPQLTASQQQQAAASVLQRVVGVAGDVVSINLPHAARGIVQPLRSVAASDSQVASAIVAWAVARDQRPVSTFDDGGSERQRVSCTALSVGASNPQAFYNSIFDRTIAAGGVLGPLTASLLANSAQASGTLSTWNTQLDAKLTDASVTGNARAIVLLAKADALELSIGQPGNSASLTLGQQANSLAQSQNVLAITSEWIGRRISATQGYAAANTFLVGAAAQLQPPVATSFNYVVSQIGTGMQNDVAKQIAATTQQPSSPSQGRLEYFQAVVAAAKAQGRSASDIQALQGLVNAEQAAETATPGGATTQPSSP